METQPTPNTDTQQQKRRSRFSWWGRPKQEAVVERAEESMNRVTTVLDLARLAVVASVASETDPVAKRVKSRVADRKIMNNGRWHRMLAGRW